MSQGQGSESPARSSVADAQAKADRAAQQLQQLQQQGQLNPYLAAREQGLSHTAAASTVSQPSTTQVPTSTTRTPVQQATPQQAAPATSPVVQQQQQSAPVVPPASPRPSAATGSMQPPPVPQSATTLAAVQTALAAQKRQRTQTGTSEGGGRSQPRPRQDPQAPTSSTPASIQPSAAGGAYVPPDIHHQRPRTPPPKEGVIQLFAQYSPASKQELLETLARMSQVPATDQVIPAAAPSFHPRGPTQGGQLHTSSAESTQAGHGSAEAASASFGNPAFNQSPRVPSGLVGPTPHGYGGSTAMVQSKTVGDPCLSFNPTGVMGSFLQLPSSAVITKIASSQLVPLWHFTKEGMAAGHEKAASFSEQGRNLLSHIGAEAPMANPRIPDNLMPFEMFHRASEAQLQVMRHIAEAEINPYKKEMLLNEATAWETCYATAKKVSDDWPMVIRYIADTRHFFYTTQAGPGRINPALWQDSAWNKCLELRKGGLLPTRLDMPLPPPPPPPVQPRFGPQSGQGGYSQQSGSYHQQGHAAPYGGGQGKHGGFRGGSSYRPPRGGGYDQSYGQGGYGGGKSQAPFQSGSQGAPRSASGASCIICGRTRAQWSHDFGTCRAPPPGRTSPHAYRNERGYLLRSSDNASLCMRYNKGDCVKPANDCWIHECSLCGASGHGAFQCQKYASSPSAGAGAGGPPAQS
ncbi:hypothetical protein CF319_g619 [Tilletia indica]|nr:hypothetical protein CF319_g619 [Tilletia indica]